MITTVDVEEDERSVRSGNVPRLRARLRAQTPPGYRWPMHVLLIAGFVAAAFLITHAQLGGLAASDWPGLGLIFVLLNFAEYATHRWTLHRPVFPRAIYRRHVIEHHGFFSFEAMAVEDWRDLRWVLFPWWALPLLVVTVLPLAALVGTTISARAGWLFVLGVVLYYGIYEVLHTAAHLPESHRWAGRPWLRRVTHHHRVHHDPHLMRRYNFSFVIPFFDIVFGTRHER